MENVSPIIAPDRSLVLTHLGFLFGRALSGKIEITAIHADKNAHHSPRTRFFAVDNFDGAADFACATNAEPGWNVYVGAALRNEDVFPGKAADDDDFLRTYALWADADDGEQLAKAREIYRAQNITPPFVVVTGRTPSKRAQLWWPMEPPIDDIATLRASLRGIATILGTDPKVCTGKQLMRLGGGVNWPKKEDRILERTEVVEVSRAAREFSIEQMHRVFAPLDRATFNASGIADVEVVHGGALGLEERVMDGRETYAFKLVRANLREWIGTTGSAPTPDELYKVVAPIYLAKADQNRAGRGPTFLKQKCAEAVHAFGAGQIPGMRDLDEAVETWAAKKQQYTLEAKGEDIAPTPGEEVKPKTFNLMAWTAAVYAGEAKPIEWLCEGTIPLGSPVLFASMGGLGKSFMALDLGLEIAVGVTASLKVRTILGGRVMQSGTAVILSAEDSRESIHRRLEKIDPERRRLINPSKLIVAPLPDMGGPKPLIASDGKSLSLTPAFYDLRDELAEIADLRLVVIDPLQAFVMADVNADPAAGQFMWAAFASLCAVTSATFIVAHHMRKDGSANITTADQAREAIRGSTALVDGARLTYALWKAGGDEARDMCARMDVDFAPERIAFGAVVKANDEALRDIQTYVRQPSGLLTDMSAVASTARQSSGVSAETAQGVVGEIGRAWDEAREGRGEGFALSPQSGERQAWKLVQRRSGCSAKEAKELVEAWVSNGILQMQTVDPKRHKGALRLVGRLG